MKSPCVTCTRVENPYCCSDKNCTEWRIWFVNRWNEMRANVFAKLLKTKN